MSRDALLSNMLRTICKSIVTGLLIGLIFQTAIAEQSFYIAMNDGQLTGRLPESEKAFSISVAYAEVATLSSRSGNIWVYGKQRLQAYNPDGNRLIDQHHPNLPTGNSATDLGVGYDSVWLAIGRTLYRFNEQGELIKRRVFRTPINEIHFDVKKSQILVVTPSYVFILDSKGQELKRIRTRLPHIA